MNTSRESLDKAIALLDGVTSAARSLGIKSYQTIQQWKVCPAEYCPDFERLTAGAVTCEELRPDVDWAVLRGKKREAA